jgi:uncharacterized protein
MRITGGKNPLDATGVHPESYEKTTALLEKLNYKPEDITGGNLKGLSLLIKDYKKMAAELDMGELTLRDIVKELEKPGRDPREEAETFEFAQDIKTIDDLVAGMELPGIVTNITAFGAFVDVGIKQNGLIHASQMGVKGMADPSKVLKLHQKVKVSVVSVDLVRGRVGLRLIR